MPKLKLKKYDATTSGQGGGRDPQVTFGNKGLISINKSAMKMLKLTEKDKLSFFEDEESEGDWFLAKDKDGIKFRVSSTGSFCANSSHVCKDVCASLMKEPGVSLRCPITEKSIKQDDLELWPIFTRGHMPNSMVAKK